MGAGEEAFLTSQSIRALGEAWTKAKAATATTTTTATEKGGEGEGGRRGNNWPKQGGQKKRGAMALMRTKGSHETLELCAPS